MMRISDALAKIGERPDLKDFKSPHADFTFAKKDASGQMLPQAIAHRGFKAKYPENTMRAFQAAVEVGANAVETDIHLTKDGVVVLSHDADLKRCFGRKEKIIDCEWDFLSTLLTEKEPRQPLPRLKDLLEYLATPGLENIWVLLDMKIDNDDDDMLRLIASTIAEVKPSSRPWNQRVVLGVWAAKYLPVCREYLPTFPITYIGFSVTYARQFLKVPHISFNMLQKVLIGPYGSKFIKDCKRQKRAIYLWTVNEERWMRWSIKKQVDGVITDDPEKYLEVRKGYLEGKWTATDENLTLGQWYQKWIEIVRVQSFVLFFLVLWKGRYGIWPARPQAKKILPKAVLVEIDESEIEIENEN